MNAMLTSRKRERGQSLVELTLVLPFLLLLLLGIVDLGRVFNAYIVITNASREGAFYASSIPPPRSLSAIQQHAVSEAAGSGVIVPPDKVTVLSGLGATSGNPIKVQVAIPFSAVTDIISSVWGGGDLMLTSATEVMIR